KGTGFKGPPPGLTETQTNMSAGSLPRETPPARRSRAGVILAGFVLVAVGGAAAAFLFVPSLFPSTQGASGPTDSRDVAIHSTSATQERTGKDREDNSTKPTDKPPETKPVETKPIETKPIETRPVATRPVEKPPPVVTPPARVTLQAPIGAPKID